jgi:hypothetical protein
MTRFWLATLQLDAPVGETAVGSLLPPGTRNLAIEVLRDGDEWAVLISSVDDPERPSRLTCHFGFVNGAKACNVWLDRGFPLIDADIRLAQPGVLSIISPFFARAQPVMQYEQQMLSIAGLELDPGSGQGPPVPLSPAYYQYLQAPDGAQPDQFVTRKPVTWLPERPDVRGVALEPGAPIRIVLGPLPVRCPILAPLQTGAHRPAAVWCGDLVLPSKPVDETGQPQKLSKVAHAFGTPAFRFEDVEVIGFRINLADFTHDFRQVLARLVDPLNFHLREPAIGISNGRWRRASADFRYRAATPTLVIELLRYGRMKARVPAPPLEIDDRQSQHELLVRLLVGRVDDDTAQAREPSMYVPAIFVDNPWSKTLGRDTVGFDKRMVEFFVGEDGRFERLLPDGRLATPSAGERRPEPLGSITRANLVDRTGAQRGHPLLDLKVSSTDHTDADALRPLDFDLTFGTSTLAGTRWRQSDFDAAEFRRSFATLAMAENLRAFRTIQVAPVVVRGDLQQNWITGTLAVDADIRAHLPTGTATLTLHAVQPDGTQPSASSTPEAWNMLCALLGDGKTAEVTLPSGSWYRLRCSMDLTIDDGLDWNFLGG